MRINWFLYILFFLSNINAQNSNENYELNVKLTFDKKPLKLDSVYISKKNDTLKFSTIKFYLSSFQIKYTDNSVFIETNSYHLVDLENLATQKISFSNVKQENIKSIKFNIGIDSTASVSGAMGGDLDPTHGMYWAWQSGYINFKIEGISPTCKTRKNQFLFHVGGYLSPFYSMRSIEIFPKNTNSNIILDFAELFAEIDLINTNTVMIPGKDAMLISDKMQKIIKIE